MWHGFRLITLISCLLLRSQRSLDDNEGILQTNASNCPQEVPDPLHPPWLLLAFPLSFRIVGRSPAFLYPPLLAWIFLDWIRMLTVLDPLFNDPKLTRTVSVMRD